MSGIVCSQCGWKSKSVGFDAENEFNEHVMEAHTVRKQLTAEFKDAIHNQVHISKCGKSERYGIYVKGGLISSCGRSRILDYPDLLEKGKQELTSKEDAITLAKEVAEKLNLSVYFSVYNHPNDENFEKIC